jgi:prefoldin subunit 5
MAENERRPIDPNSDDVEALSELPGVGRVMAQRIIEARPFSHPEELTRVRGIGPSTLARLQSRLSLASTDQEEGGLGEQGEGAERVEAKVPETTTSYEVPPSPEKAVREPVETREAVEGESELQASPAAAEAVSEVEVASESPFEAAGEQKAAELPQAPAPEAIAATDTAEETRPPGTEEEKAQPVEAEVEEVAPAEDIVAWSAVSAPQPARRSRVWGAAAAVGLVVLVLSLALNLGILASINGGQLQFASPADLAATGVRVDGLEARAGELSQEIQGLRTRLDNVEAFGGRIDSLEGTAQGFRADLDDATAQVGSLSGELDSLDSEIAGLSQDLADFQTSVSALESDVQALHDQNARTETFLGGLRDLLNQLFAEEGGAQ